MSEAQLAPEVVDLTAVQSDATARTGICPERGPATPPPAVRPPHDRFMRRLLLIPDRPDHVTERQVHRIFETSILISATRCTLAYVIFPIFAPALYAATKWGPTIGLLVGVLALFFDVVSIRRFWSSDHRWRWPMTAVYACVISLVMVLMVHDVARFL